jgi:hypothetical protein
MSGETRYRIRLTIPPISVKSGVSGIDELSIQVINCPDKKAFHLSLFLSKTIHLLTIEIMVGIQEVKTELATLKRLGPGLVAVFVGGTVGMCN